MARYRWHIVALILVTVVFATGCMENPTKTPLPSLPTAAPPPPSITRGLPVSTATAATLPDATATLPPPAPTTAPRLPTTSPIAYLPLNLGVSAGNVYNGYVADVDRTRGLLYVLGRQDGDSVNRGAITVVDPARGSVRATIPLTSPVDSPASMALSADGARLLILGNPTSAASTLVAVATGAGPDKQGEVLYTRAGTIALTLDPARDTLYVLEGNTLRQVNAKTGREGSAAAVKEATPLPLPILAVNSAAQRLYLARPDGTVSVFDSSDMRSLGEFKLSGVIRSIVAHPARGETYVVLSTTASGVTSDTIYVLRDNKVSASWPKEFAYALEQIVINDNNGQLLLLEDSRDLQARSLRVRALDPATGQTVSTMALPSLDMMYGRALLTYQNTLYHAGDTLLSVALGSGVQGKPIPLGINLVGAALDMDNSRLYVLDSLGDMHIIDTDTWSETATWERAVDPGSTYLYHAFLTVHGGRLYIAAEVAGETRVLDAATGTRIGAIAKAGSVSPDTRRNRLFLASQGVYLVDPASYLITGAISETLRLYPLMVAPSAVGVTYDPAWDMVFVTMSNNSPGSGNRSWLQIYDGATLARISSTINTDQQFLTALISEPAGNRVWVAGNYPDRSLTAFSKDGQVQTRIKGLGDRLFLDTASQRLYVADWGGIVTVDTKTAAVIAQRPTEPYASGITLYDQKHHRFYINSTGSARLWAIDPDEPVLAARALLPSLPAGRVEDVLSDANGDAIVLLSSNDERALGLFRQSETGWSSIRDGLPVPMAPRLVAALDMPGVLFAFSDNSSVSGLYRSTDGGRTWQVSGRGLTDYRIADVALSPAFSKDGTAVLLTAGRSAFQTRDQGQTWTLLPDVSGSYLSLSAGAAGQPRFIIAGQDPQVYTQTVIFAGTSERTIRSGTDMGVMTYRLGRVTAAPAGNTVLRYVSSEPFTRQHGSFVLSEDFGQTWRLVGPSLYSDFSKAIVLFSPGFATDRTVYALLVPSFYNPVDSSVLVRSLDGGTNWEQTKDIDPLICALAIMPNGQLLTGSTKGTVARLNPSTLRWQRAPYWTPTPVAPTPPTATPAPRPPATATAAPKAPAPPTPAPTATPIYYAVDPVLASAYGSGREVRGIVGAPIEPRARDVWVALQPFDNGRMIWRQDTKTVTVLTMGSGWSVHDDTWAEGQPESDPSIVPPGGKLQPKRGFGKVWRTVPNVRQMLGWAVQEELGFTAKIQQCSNGVMIRIGNDVHMIGELYGNLTWTIRQ